MVKKILERINPAANKRIQIMQKQLDSDSSREEDESYFESDPESLDPTNM